jgi:hypothetical protein
MLRFKEMKDIKNQKDSEVKKDKDLSRRDAVARMGLATFSVATMLLLLNQPGKVQAQDTSGNPGDPGDF